MSAIGSSQPILNIPLKETTLITKQPLEKIQAKQVLVENVSHNNTLLEPQKLNKAINKSEVALASVDIPDTERVENPASQIILKALTREPAIKPN